MLTLEQLREYLDYDADTGDFTWKVDIGKARAGNVCGCRRPDGYLVTSIHNQNFRLHRLAWLFNYGEWPKLHIDHIDGDRRNNRIVNLREATRSENMANRGATRRNKTGFKGVTVHMQAPGYFARIGKDGKTYHLGYYQTAEEAHAAYCKAAAEIHGKFARVS